MLGSFFALRQVLAPPWRCRGALLFALRHTLVLPGRCRPPWRCRGALLFALRHTLVLPGRCRGALLFVWPVSLYANIALKRCSSSGNRALRPSLGAVASLFLLRDPNVTAVNPAGGSISLAVSSALSVFVISSTDQIIMHLEPRASRLGTGTSSETIRGAGAARPDDLVPYDAPQGRPKPTASTRDNISASSSETHQPSPATITGVVTTLPKVEPNTKLFFLTLVSTTDSQLCHHVIIKFGLEHGGIFASLPCLTELLRDLRLGDLVEVQQGKVEDYEFKGHHSNSEERRKRTAVPLYHATHARIVSSNASYNPAPVEASTTDVESPHVASCTSRFAVFAAWIAATFSNLPPGARILEVAGGKGALSMLLTLRGYSVTLVDPQHKGVSNRKQKLLRKAGVPPFDVHRTFFDNDEDTAALIDRVKPSLIVALHPDECTEAVVDAAVSARVPFAVVPCCVFSRLFAGRMFGTGEHVRTHGQLCKFLVEKVKGAERDVLGFGGKPDVVYHKGEYEAAEVCGACS